MGNKNSWHFSKKPILTTQQLWINPKEMDNNKIIDLFESYYKNQINEKEKNKEKDKKKAEKIEKKKIMKKKI